MLMTVQLPDHFVVARLRERPDRESGGNIRRLVSTPLQWSRRQGMSGPVSMVKPRIGKRCWRICSARSITSWAKAVP